MYFRTLLIITLALVIGFILLHKQSVVSAQAQPCPAVTPRASGLVSAHNTLQGLINPWLQCATGNQVAYAPFQITGFQGLYDEFYVQSKAAKSQPPAPPAGVPFTEAVINSINPPAAAPYRLLYLTSDLDIKSPITGSVITIVFVDGQLDIESDITYNCGTCGLIFVVSGPINIHDTVNNIDAILISSNDNPRFNPPNPVIPYTICTYYQSSLAPTPCPSTKVSPTIPNSDKLIVNGSFISLNPTKSIYFRRDLVDNSVDPAEVITNQPKYYSLLKDLFARPESISTENTHFSQQ